MSEKKVYRTIGLMSGTSLDGIDLALIETDGEGYIAPLDFRTIPYTQAQRETIRAAFGRNSRDETVRAAEATVTQTHIDALKSLNWSADLIGFHGQTIYHNPAEGQTIQIGNAADIAAATGIDTIADFRSADVKAGGQGAPLAPIYHHARLQSAKIKLPAIILNIGGVANVSYVDGQLENLLAFDTGPGNALMDDWTLKHTGAPYDKDGTLAAAGTADQDILNSWLAHPYFTQTPPKSLDRDEWDIAALGPLATQLDGLSTEDGLATLLAFTAQSIKAAQAHFPALPKAWYACGGGRHNTALMNTFTQLLSTPIHPVESLGWNGDATEAECFAYLAVRSHLNKPITTPGTTGVSLAQNGGVLHKVS